MAAAAAGAHFGTPVPFPVYHPGAAAAYYAHASMAAVSTCALPSELGFDLEAFLV
jgi:hypothetical protein